ncbi:MAG: tRNA (adenosine(37)-N6)-threonylcarbamoyltransferase complex ATPase subunit type 1 TsaE, partial [Flavobacteriales bacterium]
FALYGEMGAGKTTFIKSIAKELGVNDETSSPTFGFVNEYRGKNDIKIYHFDHYRVESVDELMSIGFNEYLQSGNYCFIEWPEKAESFLPNNHVKISIIEESGTRIIDMKAAE